MNPSALVHSNDQIPFFLFYKERKGMPLGYSPQNSGTSIDPLGTTVINWTWWGEDTTLALEPSLPLPFWLKPLRK